MKKDKIVFRGKLLKLTTMERRMPNGYIAGLEVVTHPGASLIVPFLTKDKIILIKQYRPVIGKYLYELPAGTLDSGESFLSCAKREIIEETGYRADKFTKINVIFPVPGYSTEKIAIFKAEKLTPSERMPEEDEVINIEILSVEAIRSLVKRGRIVDAKTLSALALCSIL